MPRNTYVTGLRAALAIAEARAEACRAEEARHKAGDDTYFSPEQDAMWERMERQCALEAECIAGRIRRLIDTARRDLKGWAE